MATTVKHSADAPPRQWLYVEKMWNPGMKRVVAPTTGWKDPADAWHWSAFFPVDDESGIVWHVSGWAGSQWSAETQALFTYDERFVPSERYWLA